eukprot:6198988-Pleurochrysis_carterae.AAC.1
MAWAEIVHALREGVRGWLQLVLGQRDSGPFKIARPVLRAVTGASVYMSPVLLSYISDVCIRKSAGSFPY